MITMGPLVMGLAQGDKILNRMRPPFGNRNDMMNIDPTPAAASFLTFRMKECALPLIPLNYMVFNFLWKNSLQFFWLCPGQSWRANLRRKWVSFGSQSLRLSNGIIFL